MPVDVKTSLLPVKTTIADTDYVVILDESGAPVTKRITVANFLANVVKTAGGATINGALIANEFKTSNGYLHKEVRSQALANFPIHASIAQTGSTLHITSGFTQPDYARVIHYEINQHDIGTTGSITTTGTDINGNVISETIDSAQTHDTTYAFKTITEMIFPPATTPGDSYIPSVTDLFGLSKIAMLLGASGINLNVLAGNTGADVYQRTPNGSTDIILSYFTTDIT